MPVFESVTSHFSGRRLNGSLSQRLLTQGVSALLGLGTLLSGTPASFADIVPDGSTPSIINLGINTDCSVLCGINGGYQQGDNLFHSFSEFIIPPGGSALLSTPTPLVPSDVERIFIRVVGATTEIDGSFSVGNLLFRNSPDVIFLSPQGIRIGQDARLSYSGNFLFSTAAELDFGGGAVFNAETGNLLTLSNFGNLPVALQMGNSLGQVDFLNTGSTIPDAIPKTQHQFSVIGGSVNFNNVELSTTGSLYIASIARNQTIGLDFQTDDIDFDFNAVTDFEDINLRNSSLAITSLSTGSAGDISISANNVTLEQGSLLSETDQPGGNIDVNATNAIRLDQASLIRLSSISGAGHTGNLSLTSQSKGISLIESIISSEATNTGGNVTLTAQGEVELRDGSFISIDSSGADGNLTVAASAFRSNDIGADNDVQLNQGTLSNLSLPADVTGFDPLASQVVRANRNSELLPNSFPAPAQERSPAPSLPNLPSPPLAVDPPINQPVNNAPENSPTVNPNNPPINLPTGLEADGNDAPSQSENSSAMEPPDVILETNASLTMENILQFYGAASPANEPPTWSCATARENRLKISGRGGISNPPSSLNSSTSLADLGRLDSDAASSTLAAFPGLTAQSPAPSQHWLEAQAWQRDHQGNIKLIAQSDVLLNQASNHRCQPIR